MTRSLATDCILVLTLALPLSACSGDDDGGGEDVVGDGDGDETTGDGDGDGDDSSGDGDGDPSTGDGDGEAEGDGDGDGEAEGDGDGDEGDGDGDEGDGDGDGDGEVDTSTYHAVVMPGVPDRITITRTNIDEPTCTRLILRKPGFDMFDITMPMGWAVEDAMMWQQGFCPMDNANPKAHPDGGTGTISVGSWDALMTYPCTLNFDLEMDMNTDPPSWTTWKKQGVPVQGVNCG